MVVFSSGMRLLKQSFVTNFKISPGFAVAHGALFLENA